MTQRAPIRVRFFALNLAYSAALTLNSTVFLGWPLFHPQRLVLAVLCAMYVVGLVSERPRLHAAIVMVFLGVNLIGTAAFMRPGLLGLFQ